MAKIVNSKVVQGFSKEYPGLNFAICQKLGLSTKDAQENGRNKGVSNLFTDPEPAGGGMGGGWRRRQ